MIDIAPELLAKLQEAFKAKFRSSSKVKKLNELISAGKANYRDANEFAIEIGEILARVYQENLSGSNLPDGKMYYNIARRIVEPTLKQNYELASSYSADVQTDLNARAKLSLKGIKPELNQDRIDGIINRLVEADQYNDVKWLLDEPVVNFTQSVVDDTIKANIDFHYKCGLSPKIIRTSTGHCCDWCNQMVGEYRYPNEVPKDIYRRHRYCRCRVDYHPGDGKRQNVWTKKWGDKEEGLKKEKRKTISRTKEYKSLTDADLSVMQKRSDEWFNKLKIEESREIRNYTGEGYSKINSYLRNNKGKQVTEQIHAIDSALSQYKLGKNARFYRGMGPDEVKAFERGEPIYAYKSLSASFNVADEFRQYQSGNEGGEVVIFNIPSGAKGAYIGANSDNPREEEFILGRDQKYTVKRVDGNLEVTIYEED